MKLFLIPIVVFLFIEVSYSSTRSPAFDEENYFVTQAGCRVYEGRDLNRSKPGVQNVEIWANLSRITSEYDPDQVESARMEAEDNFDTRRICEDLYQIYKSKRLAKFELKKEIHSFTILNFAPLLTQNFSVRFSIESNRGQSGEINYKVEDLQEDIVRKTSTSSR